MKALRQMNNMDKGELLCRLFPEERANMLHCIETQYGYFIKNQTSIHEGWQQKGFFTAAFWYRLVQDANKCISRYQKELCKRPRLFADQLFDGHNALFTVYCLIEYTDNEECNYRLKQAIHLLFGYEKILITTSKQ